MSDISSVLYLCATNILAAVIFFGAFVGALWLVAKMADQ